ncbi:MAG: AI-2E family transporter [Acidobacteria bacterium]|nr:AI-2E family transporter [Acidobacteriota bacterium]
MESTTTRPQRGGPLEWMRWIPAALIAIVIIASIIIGSRVILIPLLSSFALAYMLEPLVELMERRGWSRTPAVLATLAVTTLALILALLFVIPSIWSQLVHSYEQLPNALQAGHRVIDPLIAKLKTTSPPVYEFLQSWLQKVRSPEQQAEIGSTIGTWLQGGLLKLVTATSSLFDLLLIPFFVFYLLSDYLKMKSRIERWIPPRYRATGGKLLSQINGVLSAYVRNQFLIAFVMGLLYAFGFAVLRVPLALTIGLISGFLNFVPYLGTLTGLVLAISFTALDGAGVGRLVGVLAVFAIVQSIEGYYLTPKLLGESLNLHPLVVLLGLVIGGNLFGLLGIILAVPVIAAAKVILRFMEEEIYQKAEFYQRGSPECLAVAIQPSNTPVEITVATPEKTEDKPDAGNEKQRH